MLLTRETWSQMSNSIKNQTTRRGKQKKISEQIWIYTETAIGCTKKTITLNHYKPSGPKESFSES